MSTPKKVSFAGMLNGYDSTLRDTPLTEDELKEENLIRHITTQQTEALRYARDVDALLTLTVSVLDSLGNVNPSVKQKLIQEFNDVSQNKKDLKQDYALTKIAIIRTNAKKARLPIDPSIP